MTRNARQDRYAGMTALCLVVFAVSLVLLSGCAPEPSDEGNSVTVTEESDSAPPATAPTAPPLSAPTAPPLDSDEIALTPQARKEKYGVMGMLYLQVLDRHHIRYRTEGHMIELGNAVCASLDTLSPIEIASRIAEGSIYGPREGGMIVGAAMGTLCGPDPFRQESTQSGNN